MPTVIWVGRNSPTGMGVSTGSRRGSNAAGALCRKPSAARPEMCWSGALSGSLLRSAQRRQRVGKLAPETKQLLRGGAHGIAEPLEQVRDVLADRGQLEEFLVQVQHP